MDANERLLESIKNNFGSNVVAALGDREVIEIMLNDDGQLFIERFGSGMEQVGTVDPHRAENAIRFIASMLKVEISETRPTVQGELPLDDSRFQAMIPPTVKKPAFSIRKKPWQVYTLADYVKAGNLSPKALGIIEGAIVAHKNIVVAGGTGSGKTTFGNAIIEGIARLTPDDRLVIIEDTRELQPKSQNVLSMKTSDTVSMNDLLKISLRLRPDRILVGEVRDEAAMTMVNAWNTGHPGGLVTLHANSAEDTLGRIEDMIIMGNKTPVPRTIGQAIDVVIFMAKALGVRRVTEIVEVGYDAIRRDYTFENKFTHA